MLSFDYGLWLSFTDEHFPAICVQVQTWSCWSAINRLPVQIEPALYRYFTRGSVYCTYSGCSATIAYQTYGYTVRHYVRLNSSGRSLQGAVAAGVCKICTERLYVSSGSGLYELAGRYICLPIASLTTCGRKSEHRSAKRSRTVCKPTICADERPVTTGGCQSAGHIIVCRTAKHHSACGIGQEQIGLVGLGGSHVVAAGCSVTHGGHPAVSSVIRYIYKLIHLTAADGGHGKRQADGRGLAARELTAESHRAAQICGHSLRFAQYGISLHSAVVLADVAAAGADVVDEAFYAAVAVVVVGEGAAVVGADDGAAAALFTSGDPGADGDAVADGTVSFADDAAIVLAIAIVVAGDGGGAVAAVDGPTAKYMADDAAVVVGTAGIGLDSDVAQHAAVLEGTDKAVAHDAAYFVAANDGAASEGDVLHGGAAETAEETLIAGATADADAADGVAVAVEGAEEILIIAVDADGRVVVLAVEADDVGAELEEFPEE